MSRLFPERSSQAGELAASVDAVRSVWNVAPRVAIVLGTGLGDLASRIEAAARIPYADVPNFPRTTALSHRGRFVCGELAGVPVIAMQGRFHFYEGYSAEQITLPIRVMHELGAELLIVSNASGGLNPQYRRGDIMAVSDHLNWMGCRTASLVGNSPLPSRCGRCSPYDEELLELAALVARRANSVCHRGVYVSVLGPNYETRAEYQFFRRIGGDAVGMSTLPEVLQAAECGMRVLALSTITNVARQNVRVQVHAQEVVDVASSAEPRMSQIICGVLEAWNRSACPQ